MQRAWKVEKGEAVEIDNSSLPSFAITQQIESQAFRTVVFDNDYIVAAIEDGTVHQLMVIRAAVESYLEGEGLVLTRIKGLPKINDDLKVEEVIQESLDWLDGWNEVTSDSDPDIARFLAGSHFQESNTGTVLPIPMKEATVPEKMASNGSGLVPYVASLLVGVVVGCGAYLFWLQSLDNAILLIGAVIVFAVSFTLLLLARNVRQTKIAEEQQKTKEAVKRYFLGFDEKRSVKTMPIISGVIFVLSLIFGANQLVVIICGSVFGGFLGQWIIVKVADLLKLDRKDQSVRFDLIFVAALLVIVIVVLVAVTQSVDPDIVRYREHPELLITEAPTLYAEMQTRFAPATQQPVLLPTVTLQPPAIMPPTALPTNTPVTQTPMPVSTQQCTVVAVENGVAQWNCISSS